MQEHAFLACDRASSCVATLSFSPLIGEHWQRRVARPFSPSGMVLPEVLLHSNEGGPLTWLIGLEHGFEFLWLRNYPRGASGPFAEYDVLVSQKYDELLRRVGPEIEFPRIPPDASPRLINLLSIVKVHGGYAALYSGLDRPEPSEDCWDCDLGLFVVFLGEDGTIVRAPISVSQDSAGYQRGFYNGMAVDGDGNLLVVFTEKEQNLEQYPANVFLRRFSPGGDPLGEDARVNIENGEEQRSPAVAATDSGSALVVWQSDLGSVNHAEIRGRRLSREGAFLGDELHVSAPAALAQWTPNVTVIADADFLVAWMSFKPDGFWDVKGKLLEADGETRRSEVRLNQIPWGMPSVPQIAAATNGSFLASWPFWTFDDTFTFDAHLRRFVLARGAEICELRKNGWRCSFGPQYKQSFRMNLPQQPTAAALVGDVDGDGREDPCLFENRTLRCDLDHGGKAFEHITQFQGPAYGVAFLMRAARGEQADLCLWHAGTLRCASASVGGRFETAGQFGRRGDRLAAGDVDGDGRDELCVFRRGVFRCDTGHDGGTAEKHLAIGRSGEPILADIDGDGFDDPCVRQEASLLCSTAGLNPGKQHIPLASPTSQVATGLLDGY